MAQDTAAQNFVKIVEVGPRDGLQNETFHVPVDVRIEFINRLSETGLTEIEAGSFVSPEWVPQMAGTDEILKRIKRNPRVTYPVLVPNMMGYEKARAAGAHEIAIFAAASETFSEKNINCSIEQSLKRYQDICAAARKDNIVVRGYISCIFGCPYETVVPLERVLDVANALFEMGCAEVSLGDTIGVGTVLQTKELIQRLSGVADIAKLAVHFHDTYGQALVNIYAALSEGIRIVDSSIMGLGGCPYAEGASGNVATEDVVLMLDGMGMETGVDLNKLIATGSYICDYLEKACRSKGTRPPYNKK